MRRTPGTPMDESALKLLKEGADNAAGKADSDAKLAKLADQVHMLQYSLSAVLRTLSSYSAVRSQTETLDYRTLGILNTLEKRYPGIAEEVVLEAKNARIAAFDELSDEDDKQKGLTLDNDSPLSENSVVIWSSDCASDPDDGVFRSKMDVTSKEFAEFKDSFLGKKVGETVNLKVQGKDHVASILGLRKKPDATTEK